MAALRPARIVTTTVAVYVAALSATAPFTGAGSPEAAAPAAHMVSLPAGVNVDIITLDVFPWRPPGLPPAFPLRRAW